MSRQAMLEKAEKAKEIEGLIHQYKVIGAASLQKVRAAQLQELKKKLEGNVYLRTTKNATMKRAIAKCQDKPNLAKFQEHLRGPNIFLFTNLNPFRLVLLLEKSRVKTTARAGDLAANDVVVPAGNTGLPPGPIIAQLGAAGLPTRIESGSVWVTRDTIVAKKGEAITSRVAAVLSKLGIESVEVGLSMKAAYDDGLLITEEQLGLDLAETQHNLEEAHARAFNLSLNAAYPTPKNIALLLQTAHHGAFRLALDTNIPTRDTITLLVIKAHREMLSLSRRVAIINEKAVPAHN